MKMNHLKLNALILSAFLAVPVFAQNRVVDNAGILNAGEKQNLSNLISSLAARYNFDLVIVTERSIGGVNPELYADDYFDDNGYGYGAGRDGCILLQVTDSRDIVVSTSGSGVNIMNAAAENKIFNDAIKHLRANNYYQAYYSYLTNWQEFLSLDAQGGRRFNFFYQYNAIILFIVWLIAAAAGFITVHTWKAGMNTAIGITQAASYVVPQSLTFSVKNDSFLYSTVSKVPRASSGSSSGGGPRVSSSGRSHGGGGRKY